MLSTAPFEFRDPIHGFIPIYPHERQIIDTFEFQRMRRIHQLGLTYYLFHGAEHSRFGHSLGVMHLAGRAVGILIDKNWDLIQGTMKWEESEKPIQRDKLVSLARLAGLLHDIGHSPFSHTGETQLFPEGVRHEQHSAAIIKGSRIGEIIDDFGRDSGITKELVADVVNSQSAMPEGFVQELISSPWDVDKMDYLLRDSHYCGVQYGTFDINRLLNTLALDNEDPDGGLRLGIEEGGLHALEGFVLARYFMFTQVYFHQVRRAFDLILTEFIAELLLEYSPTGRYPGPDDWESYLKWDDHFVLTQAANRRDDIQKNLAWRIIDRQHPKSVFQTGPSPDEGISRKAYYQLPNEARNQFPELRFWIDRAVDHPDRYKEERIMIKYPGTTPFWRSFKSESQALKGLEEINQVRLYADVRGDVSTESEVYDFCRQLVNR